VNRILRGDRSMTDVRIRRERLNYAGGSGDAEIAARESLGPVDRRTA
jgi:hypothetical protein